MNTRQQARTYFPSWPRRQQARWALARLKANRIAPRVNPSALTWHDSKHWTFARSANV